MQLSPPLQPKRGAGLSTRVHLVLLVVALLVPVLAFAALLTHRYAEAERARFTQEAVETASRIAALIDRDLAGLKSALQTLSTSARIRLGEFEAFLRQANEVRGFIGEHIVLRDLSGQQIVNTRVPWGTPLPRVTSESDAEVIATKRPVVSNVFAGAVANAPLFAVVVPVLQNGEVTHLLNLSVPTERLVPLLRDSLKPHWVAVAFDGKGVIIARSERHNELSGRADPGRFAGEVSGPEGIWRGTGLQGARVLLGHAQATLAGWRIAAGAPQDVIGAPLTKALWLLSLSGLGLVGAALLMAYAVGSRIAGSLKDLAANATTLGKGQGVAPARAALREANEVAQALSAASTALLQRSRERDRAEVAMRASEGRFRQLAEALPQLVWIMHADGTTIYCNKRCESFYGENAYTLAGRASHIHPDDRATAVRLRADAIEAGHLFQLVVRLRRRVGPYRWHLLSVVPLGGHGESAAWVGTATDINNLREAEESNARLAAIVNASPDAMMSFSADARIQSWNPAAEALFGYSAEEAIGAPAGLLVPKDSSEGPNGAFDRAIRGETVKADVVRVAKSGERIDIAITAAPIRATDRRIVGVTAAMRDIREDKRAEAALRESERRLAAVLDNASVAIFLMDDRQQCVYMNAAAEKLTGYTLAETQGRPLHDVIHHTRPDGSHFPLEECPIDRAFPENNQEQGEEVFVHKDGHFYPVAFTASPIRDENARVIGTIIEVRDVSADKAAQRQQELLLNELNHRVKNTLATVQAIAAQTLRSSATDAEARAAFEARILALSKVHNVLTRENWEGASLADVTAEVLAPHGGEDPVRFCIGGPDVRLHPRMALPIAMALHELATNAVKYGPLSNGGGRVSVEWRVDAALRGQRLWLRWMEEGGPPVAPPQRKGFGSRLIERSLVGELGAVVTLDYAVTGVVCTIEAPLLDDAAAAPIGNGEGAARAGAASVAWRALG